MITIDCGRQDAIYNKHIMTPNIDKLREDGVTFSEAFSHANCTIPSLNSIFNSQYLCDHGIYSNFTSRDLPSTSLPRILESNGWKTAAFCGVDFVINCLANKFKKNNSKIAARFTSRYKLVKNLKSFIKTMISPFYKPLQKQVIGLYRYEAAELVNDAINHISNNLGDKIFSWLHFFDAHMIYFAPQEYIDKYYNQQSTNHHEKPFTLRIREKGLLFSGYSSIENGAYDNYSIEYFPKSYFAAISYIDYHIGRLINHLKMNDIYDDAMIIITSDHGENMMDHGQYCNHRKLFDTTTKVPLIIKYPRGVCKGKTISNIVEHSDIYPTILNYYGHSYNKDIIRGISLLGNHKKRYAVSEHSCNFLVSIRDDNWQYIEAQPIPRWKAASIEKTEFGHVLHKEGNYLLDRRNPSSANCVSEYPKIARSLINKLNRIFAEKECRINLEKENVNDDVSRQLKSLGYMD